MHVGESVTEVKEESAVPVYLCSIYNNKNNSFPPTKIFQTNESTFYKRGSCKTMS